MIKFILETGGVALLHSRCQVYLLLDHRLGNDNRYITFEFIIFLLLEKAMI